MRYFLMALALCFATITAAARDCKPVHVTRLIDSLAPYTIDLSHVPGATEVRVEESFFSDLRPPLSTRTWRPGDPAPSFYHDTVETRFLYYRVTVFNESDPSFIPCSWIDNVIILAGASARATMRHGIIPVAGSLPGAFGSFFRTSLRLMNPRHEGNVAPARGKIVFHPAGREAHENDPFLLYDLEPNETVEYPDLVGAMGAAGLGSLDVIPDDDDAFAELPVAHAVVYNDGGADATFGMSVPQIRPQDLRDGHYMLTVTTPTPTRERTNIGIRTAGFGNEIVISVTRQGGARTEIRRSYPNDYFEQVSLDEFVGSQLTAGDLVEVYGFGAVVYATTINNRTNDPVMHIRFGDTPTLMNVSDYFF